jgi:multiple sugar transport system permease protein
MEGSAGPSPPFYNEGGSALNTILVRRKWEPYLWLLPSVLLMTVFVIFPILIVFKLSFSEISKSGLVGDFVGLANFRAAITDRTFGTVMLNTLYWVVSVVGISTAIGFVVAMMLNTRFHGRKIARSIVIFPWATSLVIQASIWNYIINFEYGNLNSVLLNLGFLKNAINWRASYQIEFIWECGVGIFVTIPFVTFCVLAGLQSIDDAYYEAATVDGAGFWGKLTKVTFPLVRPSLTVSTVLNIIYVFNSFPIIYTITKGAPANKTDTMVTYLYMLAFYDQRKGPATALSVIGFLILCLVAGLYMFISMRKDEM